MKSLMIFVGDQNNKIPKISSAIVRLITNRVNWYIKEKSTHGIISRYEIAAGLMYWIIKLRPIWEEEENTYFKEACAYYSGIGGLFIQGKKIQNAPEIAPERFVELLIRLRYFSLTLESIDILIRCLHPPK